MEVIAKLYAFSKEKITINFFFLLLDKIGKLGSFVSFILIAKFFGVASFGSFSYAFALISIIGSFSDVGLKSVLIKLLIRKEKSNSILLGTSFIIMLIFSFVCISICFLDCYFIEDSEFIRNLIIIFSFSYMFKPFYVIFYYYESLIATNKIVPYVFLNTLFFFIVKVLVIVNYGNLYLFAVSTVIEAFVESLILIYIYTINNKSILKWKFNYEVSISLFKDSFPLLISGMMVMIYMRADQILLKHLSSNSELANYSLAVKFVEALYLIPNVFAQSLYPRLVQLSQLNSDDFDRFLKKCYRFMSGISYSLIIIAVLFSHFLLPIYSPSFHTSSVMLNFLSITLFAVSFGSLQNQYLNIKYKNNLTLIFSSCGAIINIVLNLYLIPILGARGSVIATIVSYYFTVLIAPIFVPLLKKHLFFSIKAFFSPKLTILNK